MKRVKEAKEGREKSRPPHPYRKGGAGAWWACGRGGGTPREVMGGARRQCHGADGVFLGT